jgi:MFS family permease
MPKIEIASDHIFLSFLVRMKIWLTRTVFLLSLVSLLNDIASELLFPILSLWMKQVGYGLVWIGIVEGIAEATAGLTKGWFGQWSDLRGARMPFVRTGYLLSAIAKPLLPLFAVAPWTVLMRSTDRLGKGIRTGARDALLAHEVVPEQRGRVFGFHRAMDTLGAVIGPALALLWLWRHPHEDYRPLFMWTLIPGCAMVLTLFLIKEKKQVAEKITRPTSPFSAFSYWKKASKQYRWLVRWLLLFALFNSSDAFLLLLAHQQLPETVSIFGQVFTADFCVVGLYIFYNIVYAIMAYPAGWLSDRIGANHLLGIGLFCFALVYAGLGILSLKNSPEAYWLIVLFGIYGCYTACTDGVSKAWLSQLCAKEDKGVAMGLQSGLNSFAALAASTVAGIVWVIAGPQWVFLPAACIAILCSVVFSLSQTTSGR